jgi:ABC-type uncharacterized transport system substrate-binding protein
MNPKLFWLVTAIIVTLFNHAAAQQATRIPRIGFLAVVGTPNDPGPHLDAFRRGLRDLGYIEGDNILLEVQYVEGRSDRVSSLLAELLQRKADVLVLRSQPAIREAKKATKTIPIVMVTTQDPVAAGFISSLARPGGNVTGITSLQRDLSGKRLELLKDAVPGISRVSALMSEIQTISDFRPYEAPARALKIELQRLTVKAPNPDFEGAFQAAVKWRANGLFTVAGGVLNRADAHKRIADLAIKTQLPSMHETSGLVEAGGLMSYSTNEAESFKRAAGYVDKILKGARPGDLPVQQATKFEFVVSLKAAKQIDLTIPNRVLERANQVIK